MSAPAAPAPRADRRGVALDAAVTGACALALAALLGVDGESRWALVSLVEVGALTLRRVAPATSTAIVFVVAFAHWWVSASSGSGWPVQPADVAVLVATYSVAAHGARWARWAGLACALVGAALAASTLVISERSAAVPALMSAVVLGAVVLLAWTAGQWRRTRLEHAAALLDRAERAEHERSQQATIAVAEERARIARELHDIVAHSLSVIIAQADGGRYAGAADPQAAVDVLATVASTGRSALTDMRRLLGVLREDDAGAALEPQPDAASVPALVDSVRASGLAVALVTTGAARRLSPGAGLAVYRVVQEGLTNVLKHAGPAASAQVRLHWSPAVLELWVEDDGRGASAADDGVGRGLSGMRERMALHGGQVQAGPRAGGGFAVRALLPVPGGGGPPVAAVPLPARAPTAGAAPAGTAGATA